MPYAFFPAPSKKGKWQSGGSLEPVFFLEHGIARRLLVPLFSSSTTHYGSALPAMCKCTTKGRALACSLVRVM